MRYRIAIAGFMIAFVAVCASALYYRSRMTTLEQELHVARTGRPVVSLPAGAPPATTLSAGQTPAVKPKADAELSLRAKKAEEMSARTEEFLSESGAVVTAASPRESAFRRRGEEWLSALQTNDPALYEAIQSRRQEMKEKAGAAFAAATNYFLCRDTSKMNETEADEFRLMVTLLEETKLLSLKARSDASPEERWQAMSTIRSNVVVLAPLLENERERELYDMAVAMGQNKSSASQMVGYINQISSNTSLRAIFPDLPRGRPLGFSPDGRQDGGRRRDGTPQGPPP